MHKPTHRLFDEAREVATARPVIREVRVGNIIRTEAHYTDGKTGQFITKIIVSERPVDDSK